MWRWVVLVVIGALSARAEEWADEPAVQAAPEASEPPLVGLIAGGELAVGEFTNDGPALGLRVGARFRLARHLSVGVLLDWETVSWFTVERGRSFDFAPGPLEIGHYASALLLLELFSRSAFERLLVPEMSAGVLGGSAVVFLSDGPHVGGQVGLHLGLTRLRPSGWWFPFFAEVLYLFDGQGGFVRLVVGVGL